MTINSDANSESPSLSQLQSRKQNANQLLLSQQFSDALPIYHEILTHIHQKTHQDINDGENNELQQLLMSCRLNINLIHLKQQHYESLISDCLDMLNREEFLDERQRIKVLMRKVEALRGLREKYLLEEEEDSKENSDEAEEKDSSAHAGEKENQPSSTNTVESTTPNSLTPYDYQIILTYRSLHSLLKKLKVSIEKSISPDWRNQQVQLELLWVNERSCVAAVLNLLRQCEEELSLDAKQQNTKPIAERLLSILNQWKQMQHSEKEFEFSDYSTRSFMGCFEGLEDQTERGIMSRLVDWVWTWYVSQQEEEDKEELPGVTQAADSQQNSITTQQDTEQLNVLQATGFMRDVNLLLGVPEQELNVHELMEHVEGLANEAGLLNRDLVHL